MFGRAAAIVLTAVLCCACTAKRSGPAPSSATPPIDVPFFAQERYHCGPAALAMVLAWSGIEITPEVVADEVYTPGRRGSLQLDLVASARRRGRLAYVIDGKDQLDREIAAGHPVVVLQNLGLAWLPRWHYAVAIGRDTQTETIVLHSGSHRARQVSMRVFGNTWRRAGGWGLLVLPPATLPASAEETRYVEAAVGLERAAGAEPALAAYRAALARWPDNLTAAIGLGNAFYAVGDLAGAETALRRALEQHPEAAPAWNNLAQVLSERGRVNEAIAAARRAVEIGGEHAAIYGETLSEIEARAAR